MYAPPMPLEQPPMVDRPGVRALRGARPQMTPEMQRMRDWANSQRTATAANARNGDFILNPVGSGSAPMGVGIPTQMPVPQGPVAVAGDRWNGSSWSSLGTVKPGMEPPPPGSSWSSRAWSRPEPPPPGSSWSSRAWSRPEPPPPGMLPVKPVKPGMEPPPPDKRLTGRRG
jgi:hypothetical protein